MTATAEAKNIETANVPLKSLLFVEDEENDFLYARKELNKLKLRNPVHRVSTAAELFDYLNGVGPYADREKFPKPAAIITDLRLPGIDGLQIQAQLRSNLKYRSIPIIPISSPERVAMLKAALELGADGYLLKPFKGPTFKYVVEKVGLPLEFADC
ncbi:MAG: response regulator with CheY-like receiver domain and winged-helix DNA-binding domain [Verrucomicrobiales bacterium]|nr:response regulator with CheY-like receiver domain and winged-helix DNA-binding domain [Verrucomicrobiales bacterium]